MNKLRRSLYTTGTIIIAAFLALSCWFGYTVYSEGSKWSISQYNRRLASAKEQNQLGDIYDRYGIVLATTAEDGSRKYNSDKVLRQAVSQTVGDQLNMSGTGVETYHANILTGYSGSLLDRIAAALSGTVYTGDNITLTIDAELCRYIASAFPSGYEGAVCMINYKTGEILAMVSMSNYDPQELIDTRAFDSEGSSYFNRCLQGQYTPGSIFKIFTLASALDYEPEIISQHFSCSASISFGDTAVTCQSGTLAHGTLTLEEAFTKSCNCSFAQIATQLGAMRLRSTAESFGFNYSFSFPDLTMYRSTLSDTIYGDAELAWTGVGQGQTTVTPLHMAMAVGAIANKGVMMQPNLIGKVESSGGIVKQQAVPVEFAQVCTADSANTIAKYMYNTVKNGTATRAKISGIRVCGKTGSAETSEDKRVATNAWFVGFLAESDYPYAIAVVIEQGGAGGNRAASLAAKAFRQAIALADLRNAQ